MWLVSISKRRLLVCSKGRSRLKNEKRKRQKRRKNGKPTAAKDQKAEERAEAGAEVAHKIRDRVPINKEVLERGARRNLRVNRLKRTRIRISQAWKCLQ